MTLLFCDSFDHYATADIAKKWTDTNAVTIGATGRNGTNGARMNQGNASGYMRKALGANFTTLIAGGAVAFPALTAGQAFLIFQDATSTQVDLRFDASGKIIATRNGTTLGTGTNGALSLNTFYYIEAKVLISATVGTVDVYVNGVSILSLTGQNTRATANTQTNAVRFGQTGGTTHDWDDVYICDTAGSTNNTPLGDVRVQAILPNGNGNSSVLVGSDGNSTDNYLLVDESTPNTADYVESSTPGDKDTYAYPNLTPTSGTVYGVQVLPYAAKTDAGTRSIVTVARLSGTEADSAVATLSTTATYYPDIRETKPGGGAWSVSDVNSAEFGVKVNA